MTRREREREREREGKGKEKKVEGEFVILKIKMLKINFIPRFVLFLGNLFMKIFRFSNNEEKRKQKMAVSDNK
uniref:Bm260 n=1 Tax=Brugia malayi TaxID=6279 RepID=A0A1I9G0F0_BRUMA|nr:Bm260 [Brugia malayi]